MIVDGYSHVLPLDRLCELAGQYGPPELFGQSPIGTDHGAADLPGRAGTDVPRPRDLSFDPD